MNIVCVICRDLLTPSDDVFYTPCGHIFHFPCVTQWLERSKTCPQCREKVCQSKIHRLYFNFSYNDSVAEDSTTLQCRVESLEFKLLLKEKDMNHYITKAETADKQVHGLRREVLKLENDLAKKDSANFALNEQLKLLWENSKIIDDQKKEIDKLRRHVELSRNVQTLLSSSYENVDEMIKESRDPQTFITYIKVLKQELLCSASKRKEQRAAIKNLHQDISSMTKERNILAEELTKKGNLEEELAISESKRLDLERRLKAYEKKEQECEEHREASDIGEKSLVVVNHDEEKEKPRKELVRKLNDESEDVPVAKKPKPTLRKEYLLGSPIVISEDSSDEGGTINLTRKRKGNEENSPYLRLRSKGISALKELHSQRASVGVSHSIFRSKKLSKPTTAQHGMGPVSFDGFGGHSKPELFPVMNSKQKKTTSQDVVKAKKIKLDDGNKKLGDFLINLV